MSTRGSVKRFQSCVGLGVPPAPSDQAVWIQAVWLFESTSLWIQSLRIGGYSGKVSSSFIPSFPCAVDPTWFRDESNCHSILVFQLSAIRTFYTKSIGCVECYKEVWWMTHYSIWSACCFSPYPFFPHCWFIFKAWLLKFTLFLCLIFPPLLSAIPSLFL